MDVSKPTFHLLSQSVSGGYGRPVVKVSDYGRQVMSSSRVWERCTFNLSRAQTSSRWCGAVVRRGGSSSGVVLVTLPWFKMTRSVAKSPRVAEQCDVNIHSLTRSVSRSFLQPRNAFFNSIDFLQAHVQLNDLVKQKLLPNVAKCSWSRTRSRRCRI
ncbi:uncharacterized protein TNCV_3158871 [Trichonephila clavipes]|nr:uncharacterized protein TNCV_3158871 [Trichonephila clavipes]